MKRKHPTTTPKGPPAKAASSVLQVIIDIETRSAIDLRQVSACVYGAHPSTSLLCLSWQFIGESEIHVWAPGDDETQLHRLHQAIAAGAEVHAWSTFDFIVWNAVKPADWPKIPLQQQHDIAARAAMCGLPRGLEKAAAAIGFSDTKDKLGRNALRYLMRPRSWSPDGEPIFAEDPQRLALVKVYNIQDVRLEAQLHARLPAMPEEEREVWLHDQRLNERGFRIDPQFLHVAGPFLVKAQTDGDAQMRAITGGVVGSVSSVKALGDWLEAQEVDLRPPAAAAAGDDDDTEDADEEENGSRRGQLSKAAVRALLERPGLPTAVREALEVRQDVARSSTAKIVALAGALSRDGRLRGTLLYCGTLTGRQTGRLFQPQNLPRDSYAPDVWPTVLADMRTLDLSAFRAKHGSPMGVLVKLLRGSIVPAVGCELAIADFAAVELRILAWLAGQKDLVKALRHNEPVYEQAGSRIYRRPIEEITGEKRTFGKMVTLGAGYGLGWRALIKQAKEQWNLDVDEPLARDGIDSYRGTWTRIPEMWRELEAAAFDAIGAPGVVFPACGGCVALKVTKNLRWLGLQLPSGRWIRLMQPKILMDDRGGRFAEPRPTLSVMGQNIAHQWVRQTIWGGHLTNYAVQGAARDLLVAAALRCEARGWPVVLQVHDEVVCEVPLGSVTTEALEAVMNVLPDWAKGCPIATKAFIRNRYGKD